MGALNFLADASNPLQPNIWWLPPDFSVHGRGIDSLFTWIFWITMVTFFLVQILLVVFLIKYRHRPDKKKARFTHGNTRLEMAWTLVPAIILAGLALGSKGVWDQYRAFQPADDDDPVEILVVGEQFKWNVVYPGPDGKFGRYLAYPKVTDPQFRTLAYEEALDAVNREIQQNNPMGRITRDHPLYDESIDADHYADDDWVKAPGRPIIVPADRPIHVILSSKDVIHDFFLPNFRVKLDAVPGMRGSVWFTADSSRGAQSTAMIDLDAVPPDKPLWIDSGISGTTWSSVMKDYVIIDPNATGNINRRPIWLRSFDSLNSAANNRLRRADRTLALESITPEMTAAEVESLKSDLRAMGITRLSVLTKPFEIVCEELCGQGHFEMRGQLIVLSSQEYDRFLHRAERPAPATAKAE